jgi:tetraacyldisaccharide 4'-kinase
MSAWQQSLQRAWYHGAWWLWLLRPVELVFRLLAALRRGLYRSGLLGSYRAAIPVVIVGNITVGGTGKTPIVIALVDALREQGLTPGVVSRGYGVQAGRFPYVLDKDSAVENCGDEPLQIYRRTACPCVVDPSRAAAVRALVQRFDVDVVLCDDGLQHYALARDLEIAVVDAQLGFGNGFCLPAGPLREPVSRLQQVDHVLYRGSDDAVNGVQYEPQCLVNIASGEQRPLASEPFGDRVIAMAGIGQPEQFFAALRGLGFVIEPRVFADHHHYGPQDFYGLQDKAIIMTEKDAVKCAGLVGDNAWYLKISARLPAALSQAIVKLVNN